MAWRVSPPLASASFISQFNVAAVAYTVEYNTLLPRAIPHTPRPASQPTFFNFSKKTQTTKQQTSLLKQQFVSATHALFLVLTLVKIKIWRLGHRPCCDYYVVANRIRFPLFRPLVDPPTRLGQKSIEPTLSDGLERTPPVAVSFPKPKRPLIT